MRTSAVTAALLLSGLGVGVLVNRAASHADAYAEPHPGEHALATAGVSNAIDPVFGDWFALGSGCRARPANPGDVQLQTLSVSGAEPLRHTARFLMPSYHLSVEGAADLPSGVSECAVRLAVNPGAGFRIHDVRARTRVVAQRSPDSELRLIEELKLGDFSIGSTRAAYSAAMSERAIESDVALGSDMPGGGRPPETSCGEPKLVLFDFTWMAKRGASGDSIHAHLGGEKTLDLEVVLETCADVDAGHREGEVR